MQESGKPSVRDVLEAVDEGFRLKGQGKTEMPPKPGIHPRPDCFIHAMPAYVRGKEVAGLKWVSGYPPNVAKGLPYITGLLVLNEPNLGDQANLTPAQAAAIWPGYEGIARDTGGPDRGGPEARTVRPAAARPAPG